MTDGKGELFLGQYREVSKLEYIAKCGQFASRVLKEIEELSKVDAQEPIDDLNFIAKGAYATQDSFEVQDVYFFQCYRELSKMVDSLYEGTVDHYESLGSVDRYTDVILGTTFREHLIKTRKRLVDQLERNVEALFNAGQENYKYYIHINDDETLAVPAEDVPEMQFEYMLKSGQLEKLLDKNKDDYSGYV